MIARVLWLRRQLRGHEQWSEATLHEHQRRRLTEPRQFALARSRFYQDFHRGLDRAPLGELPVITKATVMDNFHLISTDPAARPGRPTGLPGYAAQQSAVPRQVLGVGDLGQLWAQQHHPGQRP
jgi:hypothetical protein